MTAAVIGAGSWGTTLAWLAARQGLEVALWARDTELAARIAVERCNPRYLPDLRLPDSVTATADLAAALRDRRLVIVAVPSVGLPDVAEQMAPHLAVGAIVVSATKGLDHATGRRMTVLLREALGPGPSLAALSGPNLSHEISAGQPAVTVVASTDQAAMGAVQSMLGSLWFRIYLNNDVAGVELGGALKNPMALAAGISDGLGYGDNAKAALMSRGMAEIRRLGVALGGRPETFGGLCGLGDLLATCHSRHSRNRTLGEQLGRGLSLAEATAQTDQIAEGVPTTRTALRLAGEAGVEVPLLAHLHAVLFEGLPVRAAVEQLLSRPATYEEVL